MNDLDSNPTEPQQPRDTDVLKSPSARKRFGQLLVQRWPEYLVEIIVVIIGITISFAISNFNQDATNKALATVYLKDLREDIKSDIYSLQETIDQTDSIIASAKVLIEQTDSAALTPRELVTLVRSIIRRPNFTSKNATFSSLKSSANFQLIRDIKLKNLLFEYDQHYQTIKAMELAELQATVTIAGPYIIRSIPLVDSQRSSYWLKNLDVKSILNSIEFMNNVGLRIGNRSELLRSYIELTEIGNQIEKLIDQNLE
jgi:hypothetical protein